MDNKVEEVNFHEFVSNKDTEFFTGITIKEHLDMVVYDYQDKLMRDIMHQLPNSKYEFGIYTSVSYDSKDDVLTLDFDRKSGYYIPKQYISYAGIDYEEGREDMKYNCNIHRHPDAIKTFSGDGKPSAYSSDDDFVNSNFEYTLIWTRKDGFVAAQRNFFVPDMSCRVVIPIKIEMIETYNIIQDINKKILVKDTQQYKQLSIIPPNNKLYANTGMFTKEQIQKINNICTKSSMPRDKINDIVKNYSNEFKDLENDIMTYISLSSSMSDSSYDGRKKLMNMIEHFIVDSELNHCKRFIRQYMYVYYTSTPDAEIDIFEDMFLDEVIKLLEAWHTGRIKDFVVSISNYVSARAKILNFNLEK